MSASPLPTYYDVRIARRHGDCAERRDRLRVHDRRPRKPGVAAFPHSAADRARVERSRIADHAGRRTARPPRNGTMLRQWSRHTAMGPPTRVPAPARLRRGRGPTRKTRGNGGNGKITAHRGFYAFAASEPCRETGESHLGFRPGTKSTNAPLDAAALSSLRLTQLMFRSVQE
jgi:hypothetical protein